MNLEFNRYEALELWLYDFDCMILRSIFSHRGQLRDSFGIITEDPNAHGCSRRKKETCIKSQGVKTFEQNEDVYIFSCFA